MNLHLCVLQLLIVFVLVLVLSSALQCRWNFPSCQSVFTIKDCKILSVDVKIGIRMCVYLYMLASARVLMRVARNGKISHRVSRCDWHRIVHQLTICPHTSGPLVHTQAHNNSQCHYHHEGWGMRGLWGLYCEGVECWVGVKLSSGVTVLVLHCTVQSARMLPKSPEVKVLIEPNIIWPPCW